MKRRMGAKGFFLFILSLLFFGFPSSTLGSMVETPLNSELVSGGGGQGRVTIGIDYSNVFDRQLEGSGSGSTEASSGAITESNQVHVKAVYAVNQYLNIYAKLGTSEWKDQFTLNGGTKAMVNYETSLSWGVGSTGGMRFSNHWQIFYDLQFLATPDANVKQITTKTKNNTTHQGSMDVQEFHAAIGIGKEFHIYYDWASVIFPYIGVLFSSFSIDHNAVTWSTGSFSDALDTDNNFGIFGGIRFMNDSPWIIELQGRMGDESSATLLLDYRF